ncbi:MAG TPA: Stp1/IreP family PP2C-type Ser/Thr phosphatase [Gemmatimonadaceae bacterium]|nr:Stp1/IreP family PP2C-type Ser/Thr phosphatase [Gemmatimonadaceae bacterium]
MSSNVSNGDITVHVFGRTDVGRTREHNEDAFVVANLTSGNATLPHETRHEPVGPKGTLFMVADGMGGAAAGEIASAMAVEIILGELRTNWVAAESSDTEAFVRAIRQAARTANEQINAYAAHHPEYRGMGTTATIAGLLGDTLYLAQVGDSRAYLVRNGVTRQITKDQSLMQKLIEAGELTEEEAEHSERRNIILQALGPEPTINIDLTHQSVRRGDTLVLCSDGLSGQVSKDEIAAIVSAEQDLVAACNRLIDTANAAGGPDNITAILARFDGPGLKPASENDEVGHRVFALPGQTPTNPSVRVDPLGTPTQPMRVVPRVMRPIGANAPGGTSGAAAGGPSTTPPKSATPPASVAPVDPVSVAPPTPPAAPAAVEIAPQVSPARRSAGQILSAALLVVLVGGALWFAYHLAFAR